ncbi:hypothetical protein [Rickettsiales endosymbiont of Stachyamoeba lipophora]|uniref:hypothetical protein n=1 Tax=Rickettsiales endosymbiont of Stachyamoeba lipophora TaxID=2486578 RepID=UPI000F6512CC|nr:hypothetical protein [Rickettsiales endosymbiont of Stachyamoeba lipophora]AZL15023.1 hypothetical protein EF513_00365 [Rickettsiales endosymbiont of Stachyamoeba lipophora]
MSGNNKNIAAWNKVLSNAFTMLGIVHANKSLTANQEINGIPGQHKKEIDHTKFTLADLIRFAALQDPTSNDPPIESKINKYTKNNAFIHPTFNQAATHAQRFKAKKAEKVPNPSPFVSDNSDYEPNSNEKNELMNSTETDVDFFKWLSDAVKEEAKQAKNIEIITAGSSEAIETLLQNKEFKSLQKNLQDAVDGDIDIPQGKDLEQQPSLKKNKTKS